MKAAKKTLPYARKEINITLSDENRFWNKVDKSSGPGACWPWTANKFSTGYGCFYLAGKKVKAPRVAWVSAKGSIPMDDSHHGICVCHRCDTPGCCNPAHLFLGTNADNVADRERKNRNSPGETNLSAKLTNAQAIEIRSLYAVGDTTYNKLASQFGVKNKTIKGIIRRKTWKHLPGREDTIARTRVFRGEAVACAKLNTAKVLEIRARFKSGGMTRTRLARMFGVDSTTVDAVVRRESWKHVLDPDDPLHGIW